MHYTWGSEIKVRPYAFKRHPEPAFMQKRITGFLTTVIQSNVRPSSSLAYSGGTVSVVTPDLH